MSKNYRDVYERDKRWIMQFDLATLEKFSLPLLVGLICLNFLDVYQTTLAMTQGTFFHEQNPLAAALFDRQFQGYLVAVAFKYLPIVPFLFLVFVKDRSGRHEMEVKLLRFTGVVALAGADVYLFYVVGIHNFQSLLGIP